MVDLEAVDREGGLTADVNLAIGLLIMVGM